MNRPLLAGVALTALMLALVALQATYWATSESRGRVIRYTVFVTVGKYPEDDPWDTSATYLIPNRVSGSTYATVVVAAGTNKYVALSASIHPTLDIFTETRIVVTFSFLSQTTATQRIFFAVSGINYNLMYIPSRTYQPGVQYRWVTVIPSYQDSNLSISSFPIVRSTDSFFYEFSMAAECRYWEGEQLVTSTSGLSVSTTESVVNATHLYVIFSINFGDAWVGRQVSSCSIFTNYDTVISSVNAYLQSSNQRTITSGRLYILMLSNLNIVVQTGDRIEVVAWYIAPTVPSGY